MYHPFAGATATTRSTAMYHPFAIYDVLHQERELALDEATGQRLDRHRRLRRRRAQMLR